MDAPPRELKPTFDCLIEAKAARDVVRNVLVNALLRGDAVEIAGLLRADELATENMRIAQAAYDQIPDC